MSTYLDGIIKLMFFSAVRRQSVALGALLLLFSLACTSEVATTPTTAAPTDETATGDRVGNMAPDFTLTEVSTDQPVQLAELTGQGRPVVLYFFTTW